MQRHFNAPLDDLPESDVLPNFTPLLFINVLFSSASSYHPLCSLTCLGLQSTTLKSASVMTLWTQVTLKQRSVWFLIMNLTEICDNAKKGREYALLGNYDSSMVYYQGVIQQIHKHCMSLRDPALKVKWQQVSLWFNVFMTIYIRLNRYKPNNIVMLVQYMSSEGLNPLWFPPSLSPGSAGTGRGIWADEKHRKHPGEFQGGQTSWFPQPFAWREPKGPCCLASPNPSGAQVA